MSGKGMPEMGFTLGGLDEAMDPATRVGLAVDAEGTVHGVTSWLPVHTGAGKVGGWTLDVMRRSPHGFRPVMEFLIASACVQFRAEGARFVSLSGAPLARTSDEGPARTVDRALESLGRVMEPTTDSVPCTRSRRSSSPARAAVPGLPRRGGPAADRAGAEPGLSAGRPAAGAGEAGPEALNQR